MHHSARSLARQSGLLCGTLSLPFGWLSSVLAQVMKGYHLYRQAKGSLKREELAYIPHLNGATPAWIHDFAVSENYAVLTECPIYFNLLSIMTGTRPPRKR